VQKEEVNVIRAEHAEALREAVSHGRRIESPTNMETVSSAPCDLAQAWCHPEQSPDRTLCGRDCTGEGSGLDSEFRRDDELVPARACKPPNFGLACAEAIHAGDVEVPDPRLVCSLEQSAAPTPVGGLKEVGAAEAKRCRGDVATGE
jgi:hypothetical protein